MYGRRSPQTHATHARLCCKLFTLSRREFTGLYVVAGIISICDIYAFIAYYRQYEFAQRNPVEVSSISTLEVFPDFKLLIVPLGSWTQGDYEEFPLMAIISHPVNLNLNCDTTWKSGHNLKWIWITLPLQYKVSHSRCGTGACSYMVHLNDAAMCIAPNRSVVPCAHYVQRGHEMFEVFPQLNLWNHRTPNPKSNEAYFMLPVSPDKQERMDEALLHLSESIVEPLKETDEDEWTLVEPPDLLDQHLAMRFPDGVILAEPSRGIVVSCTSFIDDNNAERNHFKAEIIPPLASDHTDHKKFFVRANMDIHVTKRSVQYTLFNFISSCLVVVQFSLAVVICIFPHYPLVPHYFRWGPWRRMYQYDLPVHVLTTHSRSQPNWAFDPLTDSFSSFRFNSFELPVVQKEVAKRESL